LTFFLGKRRKREREREIVVDIVIVVLAVVVVLHLSKGLPGCQRDISFVSRFDVSLRMERNAPTGGRSVLVVVVVSVVDCYGCCSVFFVVVKNNFFVFGFQLPCLAGIFFCSVIFLAIFYRG